MIAPEFCSIVHFAADFLANVINWTQDCLPVTYNDLLLSCLNGNFDMVALSRHCSWVNRAEEAREDLYAPMVHAVFMLLQSVRSLYLGHARVLQSLSRELYWKRTALSRGVLGHQFLVTDTCGKICGDCMQEVKIDAWLVLHDTPAWFMWKQYFSCNSLPSLGARIELNQ